MKAKDVRIGMTVRLPDGRTCQISQRSWLDGVLHQAQGRGRIPEVIWLHFKGEPMMEVKPDDEIEVVQCSACGKLY